MLSEAEASVLAGTESVAQAQDDKTRTITL